MTGRRFVAWTLGAGAGLVALGSVAWAFGIRVNETSSLPPGVWRVFGAAGEAPRGVIVNFCPPDTAAMREARERDYLRDGACPGNYETLFKPVVAIAGDVVDVSDAGIRVNGDLVPNSAPVKTDGVGNAMPAIERRTYLVGAGEAWVVSSYTPWSFDSRYFGAIPVASVRGQARPIWTNDDNGAQSWSMPH